MAGGTELSTLPYPQFEAGQRVILSRDWLSPLLEAPERIKAGAVGIVVDPRESGDALARVCFPSERFVGHVGKNWLESENPWTQVPPAEEGWYWNMFDGHLLVVKWSPYMTFSGWWQRIEEPAPPEGM